MWGVVCGYPISSHKSYVDLFVQGVTQNRVRTKRKKSHTKRTNLMTLLNAYAFEIPRQDPWNNSAIYSVCVEFRSKLCNACINKREKQLHDYM